MPDHVEFPRPLRLLATICWSLIESAGLPVGALALGAWLYGRDAFMASSTLVTVALTVAGIAISALWFLAVLRRSGLRVRFAAKPV
jgi:hypothetical protein